MSLTSIEIGIIINIVGFILGLFSLFLVFGIVKRTKDKIRSGFILLILGFLVFVVFEILKILEIFQGQTFFSETFLLGFILLVILGLYKLKSLIMNISDYGQVFLITSKNQYEDKISSIVKDSSGVCYLSLKKSCSSVADFLKKYNVNISNIKFIDGTSSDVKFDENCISVKNNPKEIKNTLDRVLRENNINCVIVDDISSVKNIEKFELPLFVQDTSALIRSNEAQGFFVGKIEDIDKKMINDISMLVDKVLGE